MTDVKTPRNDDAEKALLSSMMLSPAAVKGVIEFGITKEDFFCDRNAEFLSILLDLHSQSKPLDLVLVTDEAIKVGMDGAAGYVTEVFCICQSGAAWKYYCEVLRDNTIARRALHAGLKIVAAASSPGAIQEIPKLAADALQGITSGFPEAKKDDTLNDQLDAMIAEMEQQEPTEVFPFGISVLDKHLVGGAARGELVVIGADTSMGKSILLGMAAVSAILAGKKVLLFSLEMSATLVLKRLCSHISGHRMKGVTECPSKIELDAAAKAFFSLKDKPLTIVTNTSDIKTIAYRTQAENPDVLIVDYVQLIESGDGENRAQMISTVCRNLKNLAPGRVVFTASQVNDEGLLAESRAIGQHADIVLLIEGRDEEPWIKIRKNRRGPRNIAVPVIRRGDISRFEYDEFRNAQEPPERRSKFRR